MSLTEPLSQIVKNGYSSYDNPTLASLILFSSFPSICSHTYSSPLAPSPSWHTSAELMAAPSPYLPTTWMSFAIFSHSTLFTGNLRSSLFSKVQTHICKSDHFFLQLKRNYIWSDYYVPDTIQGAEGTQVNKPHPCPWGIQCLGGVEHIIG